MFEQPSVVTRNVLKHYSPSGDKFNFRELFQKKEKVRAVDGISFVSEKGQSIGVLGRNGSGKSTFLRLIAGVEAPTSGEIYASSEPTLLGVSAALQPALTGTQNIKLGLLAQGLTPKEAQDLASEVADFADIGDAVNRPMSTYSSGMGARLKFAISTAVDRDILLVDEALSTGDTAFAGRAQERMRSFISNSGTIFIVSHGTATIDELCSRAIWIDKGVIIADGVATEISEIYRTWAHFLAREEYEKANQLAAETKQTYEAPKIVFEDEVEAQMDLVNF